jgi:uncharacterized protein (DUF2252 family)
MAARAGAADPASAGTGGTRTAPFASTWRREHLTVDERVARGTAARAKAPRSAHGQWAPASDRQDPIALLEEQAESRVAELVPIRYGRMLVSPFTFYRGAALIMAADLAATPVSGITVQLCGDAHLSNLAGVAEYRDHMRQAADMNTLGAWYDQLEAGMLLNLVHDEVRVKHVRKHDVKAAEKRVQQAYARDSTRVLARRVREVHGEPRIVADPPLIVPIEDLVVPGSEWEDSEALIEKLLNSYRRILGNQQHPLEEFRYVHTARKVVGVGSVGTRCYIMLLLGRDNNDPLFLQVKEAQASVLERFAGKSTYPHHGQRVVMGQRLMQGATDIFLGWQRIKGLDGLTRDYYIRQFHDWKGGAEVENLIPSSATVYARICAATLARAHARWGDRIAIASYLGKGDAFARAVADFCEAYADQNERDYGAFTAAVNSGRLTARTGL